MFRLVSDCRRSQGETLGAGRADRLKANFMNIRPLLDGVVIRRVEDEDKARGGIIPDIVEEKPQEGEIVGFRSRARNESGKLQPLETMTMSESLALPPPS